MDETVAIAPVIDIRGFGVDDLACTDRPTDLEFLWPTGVKIEYSLPPEHRSRAIDYITLCVKDLPFNVRWYFAEPMWLRFIDVWNEKGSFEKAMNAI